MDDFDMMSRIRLCKFLAVTAIILALAALAITMGNVVWYRIQWPA